MAHAFSNGSLLSPCRHHSSACGSPGTAAGRTACRPFVLSNTPESLLVEPLRSSHSGYLHGDIVVHRWEDTGMPTRAAPQPVAVQMRLHVWKVMKWWEKGLQTNMKEIHSTQDLVGSLLNAGNKLVIVDFFSPGCGGCRALHPKICQFAETNQDVQFLQINCEDHRSMCYSLNVHVLPFFRFYRGAQGRVCSFSCTNATIKKFKDALAKHSTERCSLGPARGLEEVELMALSANKDLCFNCTQWAGPVLSPSVVAGAAGQAAKLPLCLGGEIDR